MLTIKSCIQKAADLNIPIVGDTSFRGDCQAEDSDLMSFFAHVRNKYPEYSSLIFHPKNEWKPTGGTSYGHYQSTIAKGMLPRIADIICLPVSKGAPSFVCELKRLDISKSLANKDRKKHFCDQILLLASQKKHGAEVSIALGLDNAILAFDDYLREHR